MAVYSQVDITLDMPLFALIVSNTHLCPNFPMPKGLLKMSMKSILTWLGKCIQFQTNPRNKHLLYKLHSLSSWVPNMRLKTVNILHIHQYRNWRFDRHIKANRMSIVAQQDGHLITASRQCYKLGKNIQSAKCNLQISKGQVAVELYLA